MQYLSAVLGVFTPHLATMPVCHAQNEKAKHCGNHSPRQHLTPPKKGRLAGPFAYCIRILHPGSYVLVGPPARVVSVQHLVPRARVKNNDTSSCPVWRHPGDSLPLTLSCSFTGSAPAADQQNRQPLRHLLYSTLCRKRRAAVFKSLGYAPMVKVIPERKRVFARPY